MAQEEIIVTGCHICWQQCQVECHLKEGKIVGVNNLPGSGYVCERLKGAVEYHDGEKRLNYPLKRKGERGAAQWERITWGQALDEIAAKLVAVRDEFGPEAVGKMGGTIHGPADWSGWRFFNYWGSPNVLNTGRNCGQANTSVECAMYGWDSLGTAAVPGVTKTTVMWGTNPPESFSLKWEVIKEAKAYGCRLIVVDPRFTEAAASADLWIQIRPGTDGAFGWGVINVMIEEEIYDKDFVENWCSGFELVAEKAKRYTPEYVSEITGATPEQIRTFARWYCDGPTNYNWSLSTTHQGNGAGYATAYTQSIIRAISGNIDRYGGNGLSGAVPSEIDFYNVIGWDVLGEKLMASDRDSLTAEQFPVCSKQSYMNINESIKKAWGFGYGLPLYFLWPSTKGFYDAIIDEKPYPLKVLFLQCANPMVNQAGAKHVYEGLKKVELLVGMDFYMTPSMALCDYVLPAADCFERPHMTLFWGMSALSTAYPQAVEPLYERKDDYYLWAELGRRVGLECEWPETLEGMYDLLLHKSGTTHRELAAKDENWFLAPVPVDRYKNNGYGFGTPSGKCELAPSNLAAVGLDPVPDYEEPPISKARTPELAAEFPLILISGSRVRPYWHSSYRELKSLRWQHPDPITEINVETARTYGITDGMLIYIETPFGRVRQKARVTPAIDKNTVHSEAYWYFPEMPEEEPYLFGVWDANINSIIPDDYEYCDFAGDNPFRGTLCKVYPADDAVIDNVVNA